MHSARAEDLATQHAAHPQAAAATRRRCAVAASAVAAGNAGEETAQSITQRAGWALIQVGLRLAPHHPA
jgi:hypothetical protein